MRAYSAMIADSVRVEAYLAAMAQVIQPGATVLDLGAGTAFFTFEACRLGARRVYAIDPNPALLAAKPVAAANGLADRIVFIQEETAAVELPERVDVIVSDMRGVLPLHGAHLPALIDARTRFLAPGGTLLPWRDELLVSVVEAADVYAGCVEPWGGRTTPYATEPIGRLLANSWDGVVIAPDAALTPPTPWAALDYHSVANPDVSGRVRSVVTRAGVGHGLSLTFRAELVPGIGFCSGGVGSVYGTGFFPWPEPVRLEVGDEVEISLRADLVGSAYTWRWNTRVFDAADLARVKASSQQSTFFSAPASGEHLRRQAPDHRPSGSEALAVDCFALGLFGTDRTLAEIAALVEARFPDRFTRGRGALAHVAGLSARYRT